MVFGDIGTSPLYALREALAEEHGVPVTPEAVVGVLSLIFWSLIVVITIKYVWFVMRADNHGEGGILALTALISPPVDSADRSAAAPAAKTPKVLIMLGLFGTALLYGDGAITPAISVLSAVEGLQIVAPELDSFVIPIAVAILIGLFAIQSRGTAVVGAMFGPIMVIWFVVLAALGLAHLADAPEVFAAVDPGHAVGFFADHGFKAFVVLGSVFLVVTGGEALYADMGHFGVKPIRLGWFVMVLPALMIHYFGQGALLVAHPEAIEAPFFLMAPSWALVPLLVIATLATIIASQALISGVFSLTLQAIQLGYSPRVRIVHTSATERGQVYLGTVNWALMMACIGLVFGFRSSGNLAAAYGVAVTATMVITALLFGVYARTRLGWRRSVVWTVVGGFLVVDAAFLGANLLKIPAGGWFPLVVGLVLFTGLTTWKSGRALVHERMRRGAAICLGHHPSPSPRSSGPGPRHCRLHEPQLPGGPDGVPCESQIQPCAARPRRVPVGSGHERSQGAACRARQDRGFGRRVPSCTSVLWLHGGARRARGAGQPGQQQCLVRPRSHDLLPGTRVVEGDTAPRHGDLAGAPLRCHASQRCVGRHPFPASASAIRGDRDTRRTVIRDQAEVPRTAPPAARRSRSSMARPNPVRPDSSATIILGCLPSMARSTR